MFFFFFYGRSKESPFFGYTLAGASVVDQYKWLAAMIFGEYQMDLRPSAVNLMDPWSTYTKRKQNWVLFFINRKSEWRANFAEDSRTRRRLLSDSISF